MIVPESSGLEVRRLRLSRRLMKGAAIGLGAVALLGTAALTGALTLWSEARETAALRAENQALLDQLAGIDGRLDGVGQALERMQTLDAKLRAMTQVSDPDRHLMPGPGIGPVGGRDRAGPRGDLDVAAAEAGAERLRQDLLAEDPQTAGALLRNRLQLAEREAASTEATVSRLTVFLEGQLARLASTPSRRPTAGSLSSTFGTRVDPFTGLAQFHAGIDFSADVGTPVFATGDATVILAGRNAAFGNTLELDHGHGLTTRFAHLSRIDVREGQRVKRGELIGAVGNTGRSTGPHLHYEVHLRGVPQNPERFLLD